MRFLSVSHSAHAFLARFSFGECAPCQARPVQSGGKCCVCTKLGTDSTGKKRPLDVRYIAMIWHAFCSKLVRFLSCTCPVRVRCPVDLIRGQTTTWNATGQLGVFRKLTACLADDYWQGTHWNWRIPAMKCWPTGPIFWWIIKRGFPFSPSPVKKRSSNVRRTFCPLLMHCTFVLPGACPLLVQWCPLFDR